MSDLTRRLSTNNSWSNHFVSDVESKGELCKGNGNYMCNTLQSSVTFVTPLRYILLCVSNKIHFPHVSWVFFHFLIYLRSNRLDFRHLFGFYVLELNLSSCLDLSFNSHLPVLFTYMLLYILCLMISSRYRQTATERRSPLSQSY